MNKGAPLAVDVSSLESGIDGASPSFLGTQLELDILVWSARSTDERASERDRERALFLDAAGLLSSSSTP